MRKFFFACCLITGVITSACRTVPDLSSYSRPEAKNVFDESFNSDVARWIQPETKSFSVQPHIGMTGSPGLIAESIGQENPGSWKIPVKIVPGMAYRISFRYRFENLKPKNQKYRPHIIVCTLQTKDKKTGTKKKDFNIWVTAENTNNELRYYSGNIVTPKDAAPDADFLIHADWWHNGTFIYDDFSIASVEIPAELQLTYPDRMTMDAQGKISVRYQRHGEKVPEGTEMLISAGKAKKRTKCRNGVFSACFGKLSGDKVKVNAVLFNRKAHRIIAEHEWILNNVQAVPVSYLDKHNRLIFNGRPFMPVGSYTMMPMKDEDFARLRDAGFNMVQVQPTNRRIKLKKAAESTSENLLGYIEHANQYGLKTLMFLPLMIPEKEMIRRKMTRSFNGDQTTEGIVREIGKALYGNTNVIGYYLSDENIVRELPSTEILRRQTNSADPGHVTTTLTNTTAFLDQYIQTGDILLLDLYPYNGQRSPGVKGELVQCDASLAKVAALKTPFWLVPQGFDWARHPQRHMFGKTSEEKRKHRIPSAEELTALPLLGAIYGAKGFFFYSYHEVFHHGENVQPGFGKIFWPRIAHAAGVLKKLEPFIMSIEKAKQIKINVTAGALRSRTFTANGKTAVVIAALKDAPNAGTGVLPAGKEFTSLSGCSKITGNSFIFSSSGVNYDVLISK